MQQRSETWASLAVRGRFKVDTIAVIGGVSYSAISAPVIARALFTEAPSVGHCAAASMLVSILTGDVIPAAAAVEIRARLYDDARVSEWRTFGTFYIDRREENNGLVTLQCYDAMLKATQPYVDPSNPDDRIGWPKSMAACVTECAARIGVELDSRTVIKTGAPYQVAYPTNYTMQQVLEYIAACHGGNWIITPENKLRLVPLVPPPEETFDIIDYEYRKIMTNDGYKLVWQHYETDEALINTAGGDLLNVPVVIGKITTAKSITINRITIARDEELGYTAADENSTGVELRIESNPYASQAICDDLYAALHGLEYRPFTITQACYDPCAELGDWILVGDKVRSVICTQRVTLGVDFRADVSAPGQDETGSEYPYLTAIQQLQQTDERLQKYMEAAKTEINSKIEQTHTSILLEVAGTYATGESVSAQIALTEGKITTEVDKALETVAGAYVTTESLSSKIEQTESKITTEVNAALETVAGTYATTKTLNSKITQTESKITTEVSAALETVAGTYATTETTTTLSSKIDQTAEKIDLKVSKGDISSQISMESGQVSITSNRFSVTSDNFTLTRTGNLTASSATLTGSFTTSSTTSSGKRELKLNSGGLNLYQNDELVGTIRGDTRARQTAAGDSISLPVMAIRVDSNSNGLIFTDAANNRYLFAFNLGLDPNGYTERFWFGDTVRFQNEIYCPKIVFDAQDSSGVYIRSGHTTENEQYLYVDGSLWATGSLYADGEKYRVVATEHYGRIGLNAMESTYAVFSDLGSARLGEAGDAYVFFDPDFGETIDLTHDYQVFVTPTSAGTVRYVEKQSGYFVIHGTSGMSLDWIVYARQRGYANHRLERVPVDPGDPNMDAGLWPTQDMDDAAGYFPLEDTGDVIDELAAQYLAQYEREVYGYDN